MTNVSVRYGPNRNRGLSRRALMLLIIIALPAALTVGAFASWMALSSYRANFEFQLEELVRVTAQAVDGRLSAFQVVASVLTMEEEVQNGEDVRVLYEHAKAIGGSLDGWIVMISADPGNPVLLNTSLPKDAAIPPLSPQGRELVATAIDRLRKTRRPIVVSDMFIGTNSHVPLAAVIAPVLRDGEIRMLVGFTFNPTHLGRLLAEQALPEGAFAGLNDGRRQIIARSVDQDAFIGRITPERSDAIVAAGHGILEAQGMQGRPSLIATRRLKIADSWWVVVGVPLDRAAMVTSRPIEWLLLVGAGITALLVLVIGLVWFSRREHEAAHDELNYLLSEVPAIIYVNSVWPDGRFERRFLSHSAAAITGMPWKELSGPGTLTALTDPAAADARIAFNKKVLHDGRATFEYRMRHADGSWRWMRSTAIRLELNADGSGAFVGCIIDITDERSAKERLRQLEKLAILGEVASGIAHEMNQPLAVIAMASENGERALSRAPPDIGAAVEKFLRVGEQAHRMAEVINHMRHFGRAETTGAKPLDIGDVLGQALLLAQPRLRSEGVMLELDVPPVLPRIHGVSVLLEQVLLNILVNACDAYRDRRGLTARAIRVTARGETQWLRLSIADRAGGIPEEILPRIFDPFFTTKASSRGTGLGLSISLATVSEMGGTLTAYNADGGACFDLALPVVIAAAFGQ